MMTGNLLGVTELIGTPESASRARAYVREKLGADHPALDDVTLLVSEVVTNAVVHSDSRNGGRITLALADFHGFIRVDVVDAGGGAIRRAHDDPFAERGRGLLLLETLAHRWNVHKTSTERTVWFDVTYESESTPADAPSGESETDSPLTRGAADIPPLPRPRDPADPL
ncbi:hypothetical protein Skr01_44930 [Sphaerisporangium krabiense]|nr:hypothetical protein Skr01_44930 [Sphaerisporangium krabiense]